MLFMCKEAKKMGWRSVAMNYRSVPYGRHTADWPLACFPDLDCGSSVAYTSPQGLYSSVSAYTYSVAVAYA